MGVFARGSVVLVSYPFSDLSRAKLRPALVLAEVSGNDYILCQITTKPYDSRIVVAIDSSVNAASGLRQLSFARPEKLFTGHDSIIRARIGTLLDETVKEVVDSITTLLRSGK